ncbi:MAG: hypothetical protein JF615_05525 [Asticcacaulis sp.]|nr:hypothetical protein [Asticcacaulis sp.]
MQAQDTGAPPSGSAAPETPPDPLAPTEQPADVSPAPEPPGTVGPAPQAEQPAVDDDSKPPIEDGPAETPGSGGS